MIYNFSSKAALNRWRGQVMTRIEGPFSAIVQGKVVETGKLKLLNGNHTLSNTHIGISPSTLGLKSSLRGWDRRS